MKKLINDPDAVVREALEGIEAAHGDKVRVIYDPYVIVRADAPVQGKVGIISGGGSGHEPMHGGFVGPGMLDAACPGEVFTSPTPDQMLEATKAVDGGAGVLHIVKNYTGDVLNFEMAADLAKGEGIEVEAVVTNDDVAVQDSLYTAGRRGVGITVIAEKICGAAAEERKSLAEVAELCRKVNGQGRSMGMALTPCITPGRASRASSSPTTRWRSASASTASRAATARSWHRPPTSSSGSRPRSSRTSPYESGDQRARVRQRHGRDPADRALHRLSRAEQDSSHGNGHHDRPQPDRQLHHLARDGRLLDHAAQARRRAHAAVGRARRHAGPALRLDRT